jgi:nucleoside-diphosphate-sugar epimerase
LKTKLLLTGASGFIGKNLVSYLATDFDIRNYVRGQEVMIGDADVVIHLAGKAHDLKQQSILSDYLEANFTLTKRVFDAFLQSDATVFINFSSVKAAADRIEGELVEDVTTTPITDYGKSKRLAEEYIIDNLPKETEKKIYILRPCMVHGPGNKGNLNLLYELVSKGIPWPLGAFDNKRSFCSIDNVCFIVRQLIDRFDIPSGIYNVADDEPVSTSELITMISESRGVKTRILSIPQRLIRYLAVLGDFLSLPLNSDRLQKLTESYVVNGQKLVKAIGKPLPLGSREGLWKTILSFNNAK